MGLAGSRRIRTSMENLRSQLSASCVGRIRSGLPPDSELTALVVLVVLGLER